MATIVNNPSGAPLSDRTYIERTDSGDSAGWAIAIIILLAIIAIGLFFWARAHNAYVAPAAAPSTINVSLPSSGSTGGTGSTGASSNSGGSAPASSGSAAPSGSAAGSM